MFGIIAHNSNGGELLCVSSKGFAFIAIVKSHCVFQLLTSVLWLH